MTPRLEIALQQIETARKYAIPLIDSVPQTDWFRLSAGGVTHVAWQVGHIAMAQFRLAIDRIRPPQPGDDDLIPPVYFQLFGKDSVPNPDPAAHPPAAEIRDVFDRVHAQVLKELPLIDDASLDLPPLKPHRLFNTRIESLYWAARHEMLHCGQIGLVRRELGLTPLW